MRSVVVLDYGSGNIRSAERAVARAGAEVTVTADPDLAARRRRSGRAGCRRVRRLHGGAGRPSADRQVIAARLAAGRPTLAICVGHQVLFAAGIEHGVRAAGCGIWPGLWSDLHAERLPHMGWNTVDAAEGRRCSPGIEAERFYFVHSYGVRDLAEAPGRQITWAEHGGDRFVAAVEEARCGRPSSIRRSPATPAAG